MLLVAAGFAVAPGPAAAARPDTPVRRSATTTPVPARSVTAAAPLDLWLSGAATCDSALGQWNVRWQAYLFATAVPVTITAASDPVNGIPLAPLQPVLAAYETTPLHGVLPGTATRADLELRVRAGDEAERTYLRTIALGDPCTVSEPSADCVNVGDARYQHTFDGAAGKASVALVGPGLCAGQSEVVMLLVSYSPFGYSELRRGHFPRLSRSVTRVVLVTDVEPCAVEIILTFHGSSASNDVLGGPQAPGNWSTGPLALYRGTGVCLMAAFSTTNTCDGLLIQAFNEPISALPAYFQIYSEDPIDQRQAWSFPLGPGESRAVLVRPTATNPMVRTNIKIDSNAYYGERSWERPADCTAARVPTPRRPAPTWTGEVPRRPAPTRIGQVPRR